MKVRPYKSKLPPVHFKDVDEYCGFRNDVRRIIDTYGSISYADILSLVGDTLVADDDENIFWYTVRDWKSELEDSESGRRKVRLELRHPQYIVIESDDRPTCKCPFCYTDGTEKIAVGKSCGPRSFEGDWSPSAFLDYIVNNNQRDGWWQYTFIIMGKPGPSGKTRLRDMLEDKGFKAFEISEDVIGSGLVQYHKDKNRYIVNDRNKTVTIILNKRLW